jgi:hypothetical protein
VGTCVVLFATYLYTKPDRSSGAQSPVRLAQLEKTVVGSMPAEAVPMLQSNDVGAQAKRED